MGSLTEPIQGAVSTGQNRSQVPTGGSDSVVLEQAATESDHAATPGFWKSLLEVMASSQLSHHP